MACRPCPCCCVLLQLVLLFTAANPGPLTARPLPAPSAAAGPDEDDWRKGDSDCTAVELSQLLSWLMVVGYHLRMLEVRLDMRTSFELPLSDDRPPPGLPPGR